MIALMAVTYLLSRAISEQCYVCVNNTLVHCVQHASSWPRESVSLDIHAYMCIYMTNYQ